MGKWIRPSAPSLISSTKSVWSGHRPTRTSTHLRSRCSDGSLGSVHRLCTDSIAPWAPAECRAPSSEVLCALARSERPLRASEVTAVTMVSGAATTKHADRLVKLGLVARERFERDGRVVLLQGDRRRPRNGRRGISAPGRAGSATAARTRRRRACALGRPPAPDRPKFRRRRAPVGIRLARLDPGPAAVKNGR